MYENLISENGIKVKNAILAYPNHYKKLKSPVKDKLNTRPMKSIVNPELELAWDFVEKTNRNIFLTGKAGTGKTTFLHKIKSESSKRLVVVAPTGVAAINAKGVTIHSFFQLPFGPILPDSIQDQSQHSPANQQRKFKFNRKKIDIIRSLDLLIIDEISMVRADLLDGIDKVLRQYKNRNKIFGGVQVLMIGDLQQLAPVVKPAEWNLLRSHYSTPYFFSSLTYQKSNPIGVELKHIYRQDDEKFISILNEIRNDKLSASSAQILNDRYLPDFTPDKDDGYITLTTHNDRARSMNQLELDRIEESSYFYKAEIDGKFPEHAYPTQEKLELKKGAQVMFIKNDSNPEKRYFNGKIGTIIHIYKDGMKVHCPGDDFTIDVTQETWDNIKYSIDKDTKAIEEDIIGSFSQMPLRLAWAITIHKSQGLTFDKAIIDAEASFAHGQTYVALSRCKTLEGIVLKRPIQGRSIINDGRVTSFTQDVEDNLPDKKELEKSQKIYQLDLIGELFDFQQLTFPVKRLISIFYAHESSLKGNMIDLLFAIKDVGLFNLNKISIGFKNQLKNLSENVTIPEEDAVIQERIQKAIAYFIEYAEEHIKKHLEELSFSTDNKAVEKDIDKQLDTLQERFSRKLFALYGLQDKFSVVKYLALRAKAVLQDNKPAQPKKEFAPTEHPELFSDLRQLRNTIATEEELVHFQVFTQESLFEMCEFLPRETKELRAIKGMGKVRVEKYGERIIETIENYCKKTGAEPQEVILEKRKPKKKALPKGETKKVSFDLFKTGLSVEQIAEKRGYTSGTIEGHLSSFISTGELAITDLMSESWYEELKAAIEKTTFEGLNDLKSKIDDKFSYGDIRMVLKDIEFRTTEN